MCEITLKLRRCQIWKGRSSGKVLSPNSFFSGYLAKLAKIVDEISQLALTPSTSVWTMELFNAWIDLFGSPDPMHPPGVPFGIISSDIFGLEGYGCLVRVIVVPEADENEDFVKENAAVLWKHLPH